jgi:hypothetical protein
MIANNSTSLLGLMIQTIHWLLWLLWLCKLLHLASIVAQRSTSEDSKAGARMLSIASRADNPCRLLARVFSAVLIVVAGYKSTQKASHVGVT